MGRMGHRAYVALLLVLLAAAVGVIALQFATFGSGLEWVFAGVLLVIFLLSKLALRKQRGGN